MVSYLEQKGLKKNTMVPVVHDICTVSDNVPSLPILRSLSPSGVALLLLEIPDASSQRL